MKEKNRNIIKILKVLPFFKELNEDEILKVLIACKKENMDSHSLLCYQGDISDKMFILTKGAVQISIDEIPIINVTKPSSFGECGAFTNERRNATIKVLDASEFLVLYNEKLIQILNSDLALKNKVYFNVSKIIFNKIAGNGPVISNLQSEKVLLEDELEILDNQLTGVVLPAKKDLISDNELDLILAETLKLPKTFNSTISFFGQKGFKKMRALNQSYLYSDYSDKMNIGLGENLDGLLFVGTKRPLKFLAKVIAIKNNQLLLKILTIETRFKLVWESLCNKFGIVE